MRGIAKQLPIATIAKLLKAAFSVVSEPRLCNEGLRPSGVLREFSCAIFVGHEGTEHGKLSIRYQETAVEDLMFAALTCKLWRLAVAL
jgi:hypothetical protein